MEIGDCSEQDNGTVTDGLIPARLCLIGLFFVSAVMKHDLQQNIRCFFSGINNLFMPQER